MEWRTWKAELHSARGWEGRNIGIPVHRANCKVIYNIPLQCKSATASVRGKRPRYVCFADEEGVVPDQRVVGSKDRRNCVSSVQTTRVVHRSPSNSYQRLIGVLRMICCWPIWHSADRVAVAELRVFRTIRERAKGEPKHPTVSVTFVIYMHVNRRQHDDAANPDKYASHLRLAVLFHSCKFRRYDSRPRHLLRLACTHASCWIAHLQRPRS